MTTAKRRFGQNFLVDRAVVDRIIEAVRPSPDQTIIEIGPGRGALTSRLIEKAGRVVAIEFDRDLLIALRTQFAGSSNFKFLKAAALTSDFSAVTEPSQTTSLVGHLH